MAQGKKKAGRPRIPINWGEFDKLCAMQCSQEEIANWFGCSIDTITRACKREKGMTFADYFAQKRGVGKIALRRAQMQAALAGNVTMLIWLGKQYLGQRDKSEVAGAVGLQTIRIVTVKPDGDSDG